MTDIVVPKHIGFIIDGNRRWAKQHGLTTYEGHLAGYELVCEIVIAAFEAGVEYVSAYIFSTENWQRSEEEVGNLMGLVLKLLTTDLIKLSDKNVKLKILGSRDRLSDDILSAIEEAESTTAKNTGGTLALCFNYGGQLEVVDAVKKIVQSGIKSDDITVEMISKNIYTPEIPPIDIVIRTSGEKRLSNFMLWRTTYSEIMFFDKMWPDMTKDDVTDIINEYSKRSRRFGR